MDVGSNKAVAANVVEGLEFGDGADNIGLGKGPIRNTTSCKAAANDEAANGVQIEQRS